MPVLYSLPSRVAVLLHEHKATVRLDARSFANLATVAASYNLQSWLVYCLNLIHERFVIPPQHVELQPGESQVLGSVSCPRGISSLQK